VAGFTLTPFRPSLVIFDCDGVLVDSEHIANDVMAEHITAAGWALTGAESRQLFVGKRMAEVMAAIEAKIGVKLAENWLEAFEAARDLAFTAHLKPVPGIGRVLARLTAEHIPFCVASSGSVAKMTHSLGLTGLLPLLEGRLYSANAVPRAKPFPDVFLHAAAKMGHPPSACVVVEDTPTGAAAARAAGMRCFGYAPDGESDALASAGAACFRSMADLPGLLGLEMGSE
jgi:HAD superfamily hydrolase (TIGR01509 family)